MIFIVVKFKVKPEWSERWADLVADFTHATRQEPGNLWFDWSRSLDDPNEYVLVEAFKDAAAGGLVTRAAQRYVTSRYIEGARTLAAEGTAQ